MIGILSEVWDDFDYSIFETAYKYLVFSLARGGKYRFTWTKCLQRAYGICVIDNTDNNSELIYRVLCWRLNPWLL